MSPALARVLEQQLGLTIEAAQPLSGGDINAAYRLSTSRGVFFCKTHSGKRAHAMFAAEARGLQLLSRSVRTPRLLGQGPADGPAFLLLEYIDAQRTDTHHSDRLGRQLAQLHRQTAPAFGLDHDNFIGRLPQSNQWQDNWTDFYRDHRLQPQLRAAHQAGLLNAADLKGAEQLFRRLPELFPAEPPALLHGDLWSGNYLNASNGEPVLIDPAVYYGHREMDLAMMQLFGGFPEAVFSSYQEVYPLEAGWRERLRWGQLYYLLVHVNLFGGAYISAARRILTA